MFKVKKTSAAGFEPARGNPMRFQVSLLNHSDKLTSLVVFPLLSLKNSFAECLIGLKSECSSNEKYFIL